MHSKMLVGQPRKRAKLANHHLGVHHDGGWQSPWTAPVELEPSEEAEVHRPHSDGEGRHMQSCEVRFLLSLIAWQQQSAAEMCTAWFSL